MLVNRQPSFHCDDGFGRLYPPNVRFMNEVLGWDVRRLLSVDARIERASYHVSDAEQSCYYDRIRGRSSYPWGSPSGVAWPARRCHSSGGRLVGGVRWGRRIAPGPSQAATRRG